MTPEVEACAIVAANLAAIVYCVYVFSRPAPPSPGGRVIPGRKRRPRP